MEWPDNTGNSNLPRAAEEHFLQWPQNDISCKLFFVIPSRIGVVEWSRFVNLCQRDTLIVDFDPIHVNCSVSWLVSSRRTLSHVNTNANYVTVMASELFRRNVEPVTDMCHLALQALGNKSNVVDILHYWVLHERRHHNFRAHSSENGRQIQAVAELLTDALSCKSRS